MRVPFYDLAGLHDGLGPALDDAWRSVTEQTAFVGGSYVSTFERRWADYCDAQFTLGVGNGTDAIEIALRGLGVGPGDEVIVQSNTFVATAEAVASVGAIPHFVDVDPDTLLLDADSVAAGITNRTAAIIVVHLYGHLPDMDSLIALADAHDLPVIEDAAQAHGATYRGRKAGSFGAAAAFSFYPGKNLGAFGDAGAVVTDDGELDARMRSIANHGRAARSKYEHPTLGMNSRLDGLQAAVLNVKLDQLDSWNEGRRRVARRYDDAVAGTAVRGTATLPGVESAHHLAVVRHPERDRLREDLAARGVGTGLHYPVPCHLQAPFAECPRTALDVCERAATDLLSLPMFPHMTSAQVDHVVEHLVDAAGGGAG